MTQFVEMFRGERPVRAAYGRQEQFGQFARVRFRWVLLGPQAAQGFAHHLTGVTHWSQRIRPRELFEQ